MSLIRRTWPDWQLGGEEAAAAPQSVPAVSSYVSTLSSGVVVLWNYNIIDKNKMKRISSFIKNASGTPIFLSISPFSFFSK